MCDVVAGSSAPAGPGGDAAAPLAAGCYLGRVMVIDDEPAALSSLLALLRRYRLELTCAQSYALGLHNAALVRPDMLLLD